MDVAEIEVRLKTIGVEPNGSFVNGLGLNQLIAFVVNVREVDQGGHQERIEHQRFAIRRARRVKIRVLTVVEFGALEKELGRHGEVGGGDALVAIGARQPAAVCGAGGARCIWPATGAQGHHACGRAIGPRRLKIESQLAVALGRQRAHRDVQRHTGFELGRRLLQRVQVAERVVAPGHGAHEPALGQVFEMVVAQYRVHAAQIFG